MMLPMRSELSIKSTTRLSYCHGRRDWRCPRTSLHPGLGCMLLASTREHVRNLSVKKMEQSSQVEGGSGLSTPRYLAIVAFGEMSWHFTGKANLRWNF